VLQFRDDNGSIHWTASNHANLPALLVGGGGGKLRPGRYVDAGGVPMSNLFVTMLDRMGVRVDQFGDSTGRFDNI
jgi:hypothetical protein